MKKSRILGSTAAAAVLIVTASACSSTVTTEQGLKIKNADDVLTSALSRVKKDNLAGLQQGSTTISDKTKCFFVKPSKDSKDVTDQLACGPIRRLGGADAQDWDTYSAKLTQNADGDLTAAVGRATGHGVAVDMTLLDGPGRPAAVSDVPQPKAPVAAVTNKAALMDTGAVDDVAFRNLNNPWKIITPAATVEVTATGTPKYVPTALVADGGAGDDLAPYYRPAAGQQLRAYKIQIGPPTETTTATNSPDSTGNYVDMTSVMSLLDQGKQIDVPDFTSASEKTESQDQPANPGDNRTWSIACGTDSWGDNGFPCIHPKTTDAVLIMTVAKGSHVGLQATVNGGTQSIDLDAGALTSTVSQVEYDRSTLSSDVSATLRASKKETYNNGLDEPTSITASWTWNVNTVALTAFDPTRGWAGTGKAWLVVKTGTYSLTATDYRTDYFEDDADVQPTVKIGNKTYKSNSQVNDLFDDGSGSVFRFLVPETTTAGAFQYQPEGTFTAGLNDVRYRATPGSVKFTIQK